jgi:hypothetical protein
MSSNPSKECPFCLEKKTSHFLFKHILSQHADALFNEDTADGRLNRLHLKADGYKPLHLKAKDVDLYCCLECNAGSVRSAFAEKHWPTCRKAHTEKLKALAEKFPQTRPTFGTQPKGDACDLSGNITITTTTKTTTTISASPELLACFLKNLQGKVRLPQAENNHKSKIIARLAKQFHIPQEAIDEISDCSDQDDPKEEGDPKKVEYDRDPTFNIAEDKFLPKYLKYWKLPVVSQDEVNTAQTPGKVLTKEEYKAFSSL